MADCRLHHRRLARAAWASVSAGRGGREGLGTGECGTRSRVTAVTCCVHVGVACGELHHRTKVSTGPVDCGPVGYVHGFGQPMEITAQAFVLVTFCKEFLVIP